MHLLWAGGTEQDRDLAALTLYWAAGCEIVTPTPALRRTASETFGSSSGASSSSWVFLGVYTYDAAPQSLREQAVFVSRSGSRQGRPPPPS